MQFYHKVGVAASLVCAGVFHFAISARNDNRAAGTRHTSVSNSVATQQGRAQAMKIEQLLKDLETKTVREKLESAFDASCKTHEIGFDMQAPDGSHPHLLSSEELKRDLANKRSITRDD